MVAGPTLMLIGNIEVGVAILILAFTIFQSTKLIGILKGSKVEGTWTRTMYSLVLLAVVYIFIILSRLIPALSTYAEGPNHMVIMNGAFLLTSLLFLSAVTVDKKAFGALFSLIKDE